MEEILKQIGKPFAVVGILIVLASLGSGAGGSIMGIAVDPEKWIAGLIVGLFLIGVSIYRNRGK